METLPDSLLIDIFELAHGDYEVQHERRKHAQSTIKSVVRVCKRWNRISTPILHSRVRLVVNDKNQFSAIRFRRRLFATLEKNVHLRGLTRVVTITFTDHCEIASRAPPPESRLAGVEDVLQLLRWWLPSLQEASINGDLMEPAATELMFQLSTMHLRGLCISSTYSPVSMAFFLKHFHNVPLKRLAWDRIGWSDDPDQLLTPQSVPLRANLGPDISPATNRRWSSSLEHVSLACPRVSVGILKLLFDHARSLRSFEVRHDASEPPHVSYTVKGLQQLLDLQAESLRQLTFGHIYKFRFASASAQGNQMLDVRHMPNLEKLSLNSSHVFHLQPAYVAKMVAAPRLREFTVEHNSEDQHAESASELNQHRHDWLVSFSVAWHRQIYGVSAGLKVHLDGYLELCVPYCLSDLEFCSEEWPWDYLELAKPTMASHGITLTWEEPEYSKDQWHDILFELKHPSLHKNHCNKDSAIGNEGAGAERNENVREQDHDPRQRRLCRILFFDGTRKLCVH